MTSSLYLVWTPDLWPVFRFDINLAYHLWLGRSPHHHRVYTWFHCWLSFRWSIYSWPKGQTSMHLTRRTGGLCTGQRIWVRVAWMESTVQRTLVKEATVLIDHVDFLLGKSDFFSRLGFNCSKIWSILLACVEHSIWAVTLSEIYFSYQEEGINHGLDLIECVSMWIRKLLKLCLF